MVRVFTNGLRDHNSVPGQVIPKDSNKWYLLNIQHYKVSRSIQGKE